MKISLVEKGRKSLIEFFISRRHKPHWPTSNSTEAFLVTVQHLYQLNHKTVPPGESWQYTTKTGRSVSTIEPKTLRLALTFMDVILKVPLNKREAK